MRAVAVLSVFADHLFGWPSGGFVGVDVFFVLSGFFITGLLLRERTETRHLSFQHFYVRRVKRILPSALLVLVVTVAGAYLLFPGVRATETALDALYAAVFAANFRFETLGADYFQQGLPPSPVQHYWSLSIEEQFYFVWPVLLVSIFALTRPLRRKGNRLARQWSLFAVMAAVTTASFAWATIETANNPNGAYFSTFTRVWELGVGALLAIAGPWLLRIPTEAVIRPVMAYLGLAGMLGSFFLINELVQFPAPWAAMPVLSTGLVVASFHGAEVRGMFPLTNPVAKYFGDTSYTLYLWHWPVIVLLVALLPKGPAFYLVALVLSLGLTAVTYRFYEDPIRKSRWMLEETTHRRNGHRRRPIASSQWAAVGGVAALLVVTAIVSFGYVDKRDAVREEIADAAESQVQVDLAPKTDPCFGAAAMVTEGCALRNPENDLQPDIKNFTEDMRGQMRCYRSTLDEEELKSCSFGYDGPDATQIALAGDSHAMALLPALWPILKENKWRLNTYIGVDCALAEPAFNNCKGLLPKITAELVAKRYALVITTNLNRPWIKQEHYETAWAPILAAGSRMVVVEDNPSASEESLACLTRVNLRGEDHTGECGTPRAEAFSRAGNLTDAARSVPGLTLIDLTQFYCTADRCPSVIGDVIVYRDALDLIGNSHITATFARTLAKPLEDGVRRALASP